MKILLMGPQGCGKGTVGAMLSERIGIPLITVGKMLREIPQEHPMYQKINDVMNSGELVPQVLVAQVIKERVEHPDCVDGYILDGWGRSEVDLQHFDPGFDKVVILNISRQTSVKRISGRRICESDGKAYNVYTLPKEELEKCKGELIQREDDVEEAVNRRLDIYYDETVKVIDGLRSRGLVVEVDAEGMPNEVFNNTLNALGITDNDSD